jgi:hypothetical protein
MNQTHTLTRHRDIQNWVAEHQGLPAIRRMLNGFGELEPRLALKFAKPRPMPMSMPTQDDGMSPISWSAWLAELDRQHLALKVIDARQPAFEFVERSELN